VLGRGRKYKVKVVLFTQTRKLDPARDPPENDYVDPRIMKAVWKNKKHKGYTQFWKGDLLVSHYNSKILEQQRWKLTERGTKEFRWLYPILMKDKDFAKREMEYPGYLDAIYLLDWTDVGRMNKEGEVVRDYLHRDPAEARKRAAGEKVAIQFRYCSNQLDLNQETFRDALRKGNHHESECWINTLYDNYGQTLLRPEKKKNLITRQKILKVLGRTEEDIKEGLTIQEVLPFFQEYKLKLRVYDVFYNLIYKYDPEVPNFNHRPMFCVTDGDHIYTLNKDLDSLAQKTDADEYQVRSSPNFHIPEKPKEKSNYVVVEHIDETLQILREKQQQQQGDTEGMTYLVHRDDNLEAIVWQLHDAGLRPIIKYDTGRLTWVSLKVNEHTFIFKSQQMIDWAIDGGMEVADAGVFNRMHDAKVEFHYQLFRNEHKSYYNPAGPGDPGRVPEHRQRGLAEEHRPSYHQSQSSCCRRKPCPRECGCPTWWRLTSRRPTLERS
jgi:hypothetical protein